MRVVLALVILGIALCHAHDHQVLITPEHIEELKATAEFEVYSYEEHPFKDYTVAQFKAMLGLKRHPEYVPKKIDYTEGDSSIADSFDARTKWPNCIHAIRDQAQCGSCWAFAASEVLSDRFCIASGGKTNVVLSPQDLVSCDSSDYGCEGGYLDHSWQYLVSTGIVEDSCFPYASGSGNVPSCPNKCTSGSKKWNKYRAASYTEFSSTAQIQQDLQANGPVETGFDVYQDFMSYKSGIYKHTSGGLLGGHAVKVVGWGTSGSTKYWIVANSWGSSWGEQGFFRIAFGQCNFDSDMIAGPVNAKDLMRHLH